MDKKLFLSLQNWFDDYAANFSCSEPREQKNIDLKYEHSYKVCTRMTEIAADMLEDKELYTAKTIALFHDIGRFKQYKQYKTFSDAESEDHAALGVEVIVNNGILSELDSSTSQLILKAIAYHNKPTLPDDETEECLLYTKLIRDADKLDIWRVVIDEYTNQSTNKAVGLGLADKPEISKEVYQQVMNEEVVNYKNLKTLNDFKLLQMGWVYDINFQKSFEIIEDENYIDKLFATLPDSKKANTIYSKIKSYLIKKI